MAILIAKQSGNFTDASTWYTIEPTSFMAVRDTQETAVAALSTAYKVGTAFTLASTVSCDGVALKYAATTGNGTITVRLYNVTASAVIANTTVTFNASYLTASTTTATTTNASSNWIFINFPATVTLPAASIRVEILGSINANAYFHSKSSGNNWTFALRTPTTAAPAASDLMLVMPEVTTSGSLNTFTVTCNNTATTTFGNATTGTSALEVSAGCTFQFATAASTNYYLKLAGFITINEGSTFTCGTLAYPIPSTSTATIEFVNATTNAKYGINQRNSSTPTTSTPTTISFYGPSKNSYVCYTTADVNVGATSLTVTNSADIAGWKNGDYIVFPPTDRVITKAESKTLTADASGTTLSFGALTNLHQAYIDSAFTKRTPILNFTRNIKILGTDSTHASYFTVSGGANLILQDVEFVYMGGLSAANDGKGLKILSKSGFFSDINNCSFRTSEAASSTGINLDTSAANQYGITVYNCFFYRSGTTAIQAFSYTPYNTNYFVSMSNIYSVGAGTTNTSSAVIISGYIGSFEYFYISGSIGVTLTSPAISTSSGLTIQYDNTLGTYTPDFALLLNTNNMNVFSCQQGLTLNYIVPPMSDLNSSGFEMPTGLIDCYFGRSTSGVGVSLNCANALFLRCDISDNSTQNVQLNSCNNLIFHTCNLGSSVTYSTPTCIAVDQSRDIKFVNCTAQAGSILVNVITASVIQDIDMSFIGGTITLPINVIPLAATNFFSPKSKISFSKCISSAPTIFRTYKAGGYLESSNTTYFDSAPGMYLVPTSNSTRNLNTEIKYIPVPSGKKVVVSVYINVSNNLTSLPALWQFSPYENNTTNFINSAPKRIMPVDPIPANTWTKIQGTSETATVDTVFGFFLSVPPCLTGYLYVDKWEVYYE